MNIKLTNEQRKQSIASIKRYLQEELDQEIGSGAIAFDRRH